MLETSSVIANRRWQALQLKIAAPIKGFAPRTTHQNLQNRTVPALVRPEGLAFPTCGGSHSQKSVACEDQKFLGRANFLGNSSMTQFRDLDWSENLLPTPWAAREHLIADVTTPFRNIH